MVGAISSRVFKCKSELTPEALAVKLKRAKLSEIVDNPETGEEETLLTTIEDVTINSNGSAVRGVVSMDSGQEFPPNREGKVRFAVVNDKIPFSFLFGSLFFVPYTRSKQAGTVAYKIGRMVMNPTADPILSCRISTQNIRTFLQTHRHQLNDCSWKDITLPNLTRVNFGGIDIENSTEYGHIDNHGQPKSILVRLLESSWSVRINEEAVITFYNNQSVDTIEEFLRRHIFPLCD